ncbi:hypothetical protein PsAD2_04443 [Pseudovibrio axinellae]|uniref:HTH luxR-type domain-containing protein n=1 Tax=Pseudovibrio axinellae TaxID=989403 RepID=A0A165SZJ0_9HYPH|nr:hypothetical protein [Pseudovibrio axinellae]KZL05088.1 hypothetical protein PsAD2_04443 [Pseudovibrio axinellae]SER47911.1 DNA-binding transcriptional regulator, CsgD family [Pseudovibrio axinellae]
MRDEIVKRLYANIALGEDIGMAFEPMASAFQESMFCYKNISLNTLGSNHLTLLNTGDDMKADMLAAEDINPFLPLAKFIPLSSVVQTEHYINPDEIRDTAFYEKVFKKQGAFDRARSFILHRQGVEVAMASFAVTAEFGSTHTEQLDAALEAVRPHFQSAFSVALHLEKRRDHSTTQSFWLDRVPSAAFILNQGLHVALANEQAEALFQSSKSFFIDQRGEVSSRYNCRRKLLEDTISECRLTGKPLGPRVFSGGSVPNPFFVVMPIDVFAETPAYLLPFVRGPQPLLCIIMDPADQPLAELDSLRKYLGISLRDAKFVQFLVRGATVAETSDAMEMSYNTARNHMARIVKEVAVGSQNELVRLASDLGARIPR